MWQMLGYYISPSYGFPSIQDRQFSKLGTNCISQRAVNYHKQYKKDSNLSKTALIYASIDTERKAIQELLPSGSIT
jgi:hypothetical protein